MAFFNRRGRNWDATTHLALQISKIPLYHGPKLSNYEEEKKKSSVNCSHFLMGTMSLASSSSYLSTDPPPAGLTTSAPLCISESPTAIRQDLTVPRGCSALSQPTHRYQPRPWDKWRCLTFSLTFQSSPREQQALSLRQVLNLTGGARPCASVKGLVSTLHSWTFESCF